MWFNFECGRFIHEYNDFCFDCQFERFAHKTGDLTPWDIIKMSDLPSNRPAWANMAMALPYHHHITKADFSHFWMGFSKNDCSFSMYHKFSIIKI